MIAVGVDTHKDEHVAAALDGDGQLLGEIVVTANRAGYCQLTKWLVKLGEDALVGIEGAGSYGVGLGDHLQDAGIRVVEVERPRRRDRPRGKSDRIDALLAAKRVLAGDGLSTPRGSDTRAALQTLLAAYRLCVAERTRALNQLQALHVTAPAALRERIGAGNGTKLARRLARMRTGTGGDMQETTTLTVLRDLARRAIALREQTDHYEREIETLVRSLEPTLLDQPGVGPISAGKLLACNPRRFKSEAAFARCNGHGTAPRVLGQDDPPPSQPRRRPSSQQRALHDRALPLDPPPRNTRLPGPPNQRGKDQTRGDALAQATPLPPPLQATHSRTLDFIEASNELCARRLRSWHPLRQRARIAARRRASFTVIPRWR